MSYRVGKMKITYTPLGGGRAVVPPAVQGNTAHTRHHSQVWNIFYYIILSNFVGGLKLRIFWSAGPGVPPGVPTLICFTYAKNKKLTKPNPPRWILTYIKLESSRWGGWDKCRRLIYLFENLPFGVVSLVILQIRQFEQLATTLKIF